MELSFMNYHNKMSHIPSSVNKPLHNVAILVDTPIA